MSQISTPHISVTTQLIVMKLKQPLPKTTNHAKRYIDPTTWVVWEWANTQFATGSQYNTPLLFVRIAVPSSCGSSGLLSRSNLSHASHRQACREKKFMLVQDEKCPPLGCCMDPQRPREHTGPRCGAPTAPVLSRPAHRCI